MTSWNPWFLRARLRTRHLMLLSAIGEEGNICRAAEMLNMSQPAASRLLRDLEEIIGTNLFERQARGVKANWYGEALIRHARNALSSLTEAAAEIDALKAGRTGQVNVGAIGGPAVGLVPRALVRVARDYPLVRVQVIVDASERLMECLGDGRIDLMVGRLGAQEDCTRFSFQRLSDESVCAVACKGHPLSGGQPVALTDVVDATWIVPPAGTDLRRRFDLMFREAGLNCPARLIETDSPMVVTRLLESTHFIALLSRDVAEYYVEYGLVAELPLELPCTLDPFGIVTRNGWLLSPAAILMQEALEDESMRVPRAQPTAIPVAAPP